MSRQRQQHLVPYLATGSVSWSVVGSLLSFHFSILYKQGSLSGGVTGMKMYLVLFAVLTLSLAAGNLRHCRCRRRPLQRLQLAYSLFSGPGESGSTQQFRSPTNVQMSEFHFGELQWGVETRIRRQLRVGVPGQQHLSGNSVRHRRSGGSLFLQDEVSPCRLHGSLH